MKLENKVAIVTGGGRGMGREFALAYAEEGADVAVVARSVGEIEAVAKEIRALGRKALAIPTDVRKEDQVNQMVNRTLEEFGKIDILAAIAGGSFGAALVPLWELTLELWQTNVDINMTGTFLCIKAVVPHMMKQKSGSIILMSSWEAQPRSWASGFAAYAPTKWGIEGLKEVCAAELAPYNVRVNALRPGGPTATHEVMDSVDVTKYDLRRGPVVRPDIVRPVAVYLASDDSASITGESFECKRWNREHGFGDASKYWYEKAKHDYVSLPTDRIIPTT